MKLNLLAVAVLASKSRTWPATIKPPLSRLTVPSPVAPPSARPALAVVTLEKINWALPLTLSVPVPLSPEMRLLVVEWV